MTYRKEGESWRKRTHLSGELVKDVAAMGVQNGNGLSKVVSLLKGTVEMSHGRLYVWSAVHLTFPFLVFSIDDPMCVHVYVHVCVRVCVSVHELTSITEPSEL